MHKQIPNEHAAEKRIVVGLAGNPNVGKTTIFNALTGTRQRTGNWAGVTVEKKSGTISKFGYEIEIVDLPGTYSLNAYSPDEKIASSFIINEKPDLIIQVVDSTNLERNLYLTTQILELTDSVVLALNLSDAAEREGITIDADALCAHLPAKAAIKTTGTKNLGIDELIKAVIDIKEKNNDNSANAETTEQTKNNFKIDFSQKTEKLIADIVSAAKFDPAFSQNVLNSLNSQNSNSFSLRRFAVSLIEEDEGSNEILASYPKLKGNVETLINESGIELIQADIADVRYSHISNVLNKSVKYALGKDSYESKRNLISRQKSISPSDSLDRVVTDKWLGIPIFLALMCGAFELTFTLGTPFMTIIESIVGMFAEIVTGTVPGLLGSVLGNGIISGVGSVLVFLPNIMILFFILAILEDTGYLSRAAFVMDRPMHALGLPGKAFIPMLSGFGCSVPGVMASRTIENNKDRLLTILVTPFMSCGARLPVYVLFAGVFFSAVAGQIIFSLYILGILVAIISALIFKRTILKGDSAPFIMEMPPYRIPTLFAAIEHMWSRGGLYIKKAGTFILIGAVIVWALASFPIGVEYGSQESYAGAIGTAISPIFEPLGFDWKISVALIFGFLAKEVVVGSLGVLYGAGEDESMLTTALLNDPVLTPVTALSLMVFVLLYMPCVAVMGTVRKETGSWKWTGFMALYTCVTAWIVAYVVSIIAGVFI